MKPPSIDKKPGFNWRRLFVLCWYREQNGYQFNIVMFLADIYLWFIAFLLLMYGFHAISDIPWSEIFKHIPTPNPLQGI